LLALCSTLATAQTSAVPGYISYQGRVVDAAGANVGAGTPVNRTVIFRIWDNPSSTATANLIYSEAQTVTVSEGEFSVLVGQGVANTTETFSYSEAAKKLTDFSTAFTGKDRYLGVTVAAAATIASTDYEITPRQQIVSTAFAMRAKYAEQVGSNGIAALTALDSGRVGIGTLAPPALFTVSGANLTTTTTSPQLLVTADDLTERLRIGVDSTGTGTGFLQAFKEGTGAQNLLLNPNGGNVGIGNTNPAVALSVTGAITATGAITGESFTTAGNITTGSGSVGIGTTTPTAKLTIGSSLGGNNSTLSTSFLTNAGTLGAAVNSELNLGNFGFTSTNNTSLAISAYRTAANTDWQGTALLLGMNVDVTRRAGGWISIHGNGNVGIGKADPSVALDVTGAVKASTTITAGTTIAAGTTITAGGKSVPTSEEANLKIIRGSVKSNGDIESGGGFTVTKVVGQTGLYQITFTSQFSSAPSVTATATGRSNYHAEVYEPGRSTYPPGGDRFPGANGFTIGINRYDTTAVDDQSFSFIAIGPR
jgi:hypothetical protein